MRRIFVLSALCASFVLISCSKNQPLESRGMIAEVDGQVRALSEDEAKTICQNQYCEPNYIYHASFGGRRSDPPPAQPAPSPPTPPDPPPATPTPPAPPTPVDPVTPPSPSELGYQHTIMNVDKAWTLTKGSRDIVVAVVDTGVQVDHPDLAANIWANPRELNGTPGADDDGNGFVDDVYGWDFANNRPNAIDDNRHGTHCAGIIGAVQNNSGVVGISPRVRIMPVKFMDASGSGTTDAAIKAINYAVDNGAQIISNSWGGGGRSELLNQAIQRAISKGVLVLAAAGNESNDNDQRPSYPASYSGVIAVASSDQQDEISLFSNFGKNTVMVAAPGSTIYSTVPRNSYASLSGTSMATPQVAGALALALSANNKLSVNQMKQALCDSARKIHLTDITCGRVDVYNLVNTVLRF